MSHRILIPLLCLATLPLHAQDGEKKPKDHFVKKEAAAAAEDVIMSVGVLVEYIQLDHRTANQLVREHATRAANCQALRDELEKLLDAGEAELVETDWIHARSGQRAKTESITERIYPTEYDPPEIPNNIGDTSPEAHSNVTPEGEAVPTPTAPPYPMTASSPTAFETRNLGSTLEVDPVISAKNDLIDLNLAPEIVQEIGMYYYSREERIDTNYGVDHQGMPKFYTIKATTQVTVVPGHYALLSVEKPHDAPDQRILVLVRADLIPVD